MGMPVMDVGKVRVRVSDRRMLMRMRVRLLTVPIKIMRMLMVLDVPVSMVTHSAAAVDEQRTAFRRERSSGFSLPKLP